MAPTRLLESVLSDRQVTLMLGRVGCGPLAAFEPCRHRVCVHGTSTRRRSLCGGPCCLWPRARSLSQRPRDYHAWSHAYGTQGRTEVRSTCEGSARSRGVGTCSQWIQGRSESR